MSAGWFVRLGGFFQLLGHADGVGEVSGSLHCSRDGEHAHHVGGLGLHHKPLTNLGRLGVKLSW